MGKTEGVCCSDNSEVGARGRRGAARARQRGRGCSERQVIARIVGGGSRGRRRYVPAWRRDFGPFQMRSDV
jgi:hypothetical protein